MAYLQRGGYGMVSSNDDAPEGAPGTGGLLAGGRGFMSAYQTALSNRKTKKEPAIETVDQRKSVDMPPIVNSPNQSPGLA